MKVSPIFWSVLAAVAALASAEANQSPIAVDDTSNASARGLFIDVLNNDSDPDGDALKIVSVSQPAHGKASIRPGTPKTLVQYVLGPDFAGDDSFTYTISDPSGATATATV